VRCNTQSTKSTGTAAGWREVVFVEYSSDDSNEMSISPALDCSSACWNAEWSA
jgi:hypothetical protein